VLCFVPSEAQTLSAQDPNAVKAARGRRVSSTSVTVITPGAGCSITSTATVSTTTSGRKFHVRVCGAIKTSEPYRL
jgi:hypothetical protein